MYAMIHPSLYLIQIATEWGIFRRQWCARTLDIYDQILHWCATCRLLLQQYWKVKCPTIWNQNKKHGNDPP